MSSCRWCVTGGSSRPGAWTRRENRPDGTSQQPSRRSTLGRPVSWSAGPRRRPSAPPARTGEELVRPAWLPTGSAGLPVAVQDGGTQGWLRRAERRQDGRHGPLVHGEEGEREVLDADVAVV